MIVSISNSLKNFLFSRRECSIEVSLQKIRYAAKNNWFNAMNLSKSSYSEIIAAPEE